MNEPWIPSQITKSDEFKERVLALAIQYPTAFKVLPISEGKPEEKGRWASYDFDGVVQIWANTAAPDALQLYQDVLYEKKEAIMTKELTTIEKKNVFSMLSTNFKAIQSVLPDNMKPEKVLRLGYQIVVKNPKLARECTPASLMNAILESASLGLEVGGPLGLAHILPYKGVAELRLDYKGELDLMYRSPLVSKIVTNAVYANDEFEYEYGSNQFLRHRPAYSNKGNLVAAYCHVFFTNGTDTFVVCDQEMADYAKSCSDAKNSKFSPWNKPGEIHWMWIKTAVHRIAKTVPKSPELQRAVALNTAADQGQPQETKFDHAIDVEFSELQKDYDGGNGGKQPEDEKQETMDITPETDTRRDAQVYTAKPEPEKKGEPEPEPAGDLTPEETGIMKNYVTAKKSFPDEYGNACKKLDLSADMLHSPVQAGQILNGINQILDAQMSGISYDMSFNRRTVK